MTRACPLSCDHCRADAQHRRHPDELSTAEGIELIRGVAEAGVKVFVITGGDPLTRGDVYDLVAASAEAGMHTGFSPSGTPRLNRDALERAQAAGAATVHLSLDGASAETHDRFRGVTGTFERTITALENCVDLGIRVQVGTSVTRETVRELPAVAELLDGLVDLWSLFFLVPTGRGQIEQMLDAEGHESAMHWLATTEFPFAVRTIAGPTYRRVLAQMGRPVAPGVNDGDGICFVSHTGEVCPSGFLQLPVGNVRDRPLIEWYREAPLFQALRDRGRLTGKCGTCGFRELCGGSRARAWAMTGDPLASDPT
ncbi:MAG: radical SAM protein, partial [Actinomycetia bacterium]|nr:radical SAM protein [Actinomycetes bacterium]